VQVSYQSVNAEPINIKLMYFLRDVGSNPLGSEGAFHLSKGEWKKIIAI
jgi:hypothetical protein